MRSSGIFCDGLAGTTLLSLQPTQAVRNFDIVIRKNQKTKGTILDAVNEGKLSAEAAAKLIKSI